MVRGSTPRSRAVCVRLPLLRSSTSRMYRRLKSSQACASVVIADMNEGTGKETLELAAKLGAADRARFVRANVADEDDVAAMVERGTA